MTIDDVKPGTIFVTRTAEDIAKAEEHIASIQTEERVRDIAVFQMAFAAALYRKLEEFRDLLLERG
jgi:hypothetical protein